MQYGHFDNENREYVIDRVDLPTSWTNYIGVKDMCAVLNHTAGGYIFYKSPEYHRITRFRPNGVPMDRPGHYVYLRDDESGDYWSVSWQPVGKPLDQAKYTCRHGMSYSVYECDYSDIFASQKMSVAMDDPVEIWDVRIKNNSDRTRKLSVFSYLEFSFHQIAMDNQNFQMSMYASGSSYEDGIIECDLFYEEFGYQFFTADFTPDSYDCLRDKFIGSYRTEDNPIGVENGHLSGSSELGNNHCGALHKQLVLKPGEEVRVIFLLGEGTRENGKKIRAKYANGPAADHVYEQLKVCWDKKINRLQIHTPDEGMNTLINTWTLYQAEVNIMFSRFASFIEVGGRTGLGYRDTSQGSMTVPHSNPEKCRQRIVELLRGLVKEGYGLHLFQPEWFDPEEKGKKPFKSPTVVPTPKLDDMIHGIEDTCSDDALWLVASINEYIKETGEFSFLDEIYTYVDGGEGSVYEHMKRILDFSCRQVGEDGICKGLRADWNDCLNLGGGESAMEFYHALCPYYQNDKIEIREAEPYSYCQFVVGKDHTAFGRARHPFMTGTGGWAYYSATHYMLGIRPGMDALEIDPCIPKGCDGFTLTRQWRGAQYDITVENPEHVSKGVCQIFLDGALTEKIPVQEAGSTHKVRIVMGSTQDEKEEAK